MYRCLDCETMFKNSNKIPTEIFYGIDSEFNYRSDSYVEICPNCESNNIEKQVTIDEILELEDKNNVNTTN